jgi:DNA-cytosine methyltransferase
MVNGEIVLSLFDGMSCGRIALEKQNIKVDTYYASEIDKYAQIVSNANYPDIIRLGDVKNVDVSKLKPISLLIGGSPCQSFSFAGKRKGMSTKDNIEILTIEHYLELRHNGFEFEGQSYLFWEYIRILTDIRKYNPDVKFLLENVMMGEKWQKILTQAIGINPIEINSALVSAQNRRRLYWTNIGAESDGLFGDLVCKITQPKDKGILLKDVLESEVDEKYYLSEKSMKLLGNELINKSTSKDKSMTIDSSYYKGVGIRCGDCRQVVSDILKIDKKGKISNNQDKASCFTAGGHSGGNHSDMDLIVHNMMPRSGDPKKGGTGHLTRTDGKTYCLDTGNTNAVEIRKDNLAYGCDYRKDEGFCVRKTEKSTTLMARAREDVYGTGLVMQLNPSTEIGGKQPFQQNRIYDINGISPALMSQLSCGSNLINTNKIRRLTPIECERLQTVPDGFTAHVSDSQRYKMLGNGWTIDVIAHIFSFIK